MLRNDRFVGTLRSCRLGKKNLGRMRALPIVPETDAGRSEPHPYKGKREWLRGHGSAVPLHNAKISAAELFC